MSAYRTAYAGAMMVATRFGSRILDLFTVIILARLLSPADFGLVAIATSLVAMIEAGLEIPLVQALLRLDVIQRRHYDTAFTLGVLRCGGVYALLTLALWPLSIWYHDPRLTGLVLVVGVGALGRGLTSPRLAEYQKVLDFRRDVSIELSGKITGGAIGVAVAYFTHSYWAVAATGVSNSLVTLIVSYALAPYRPRFSLSSWPLFSSFIGWLSLAQVIGTINWQSERMILGRFVPISRLGLFFTASDLSQIPIFAIFGPVLRPMLAGFQSISGDRERLARSYSMATRVILTIGTPILVGESLVADPIVRIALGEKWLGAIPLLQWLAPTLIPALFVLPSISLIPAIGNARDLVLRNALEILTKLPLLWFGYLAFGLSGVALARLVSEGVASVVCMRTVKRLIGLSITRQLMTAWSPFAATAIMGVAVVAFRTGLTDELKAFGALGDLLASSAFGAAVYAVVLYVLWRVSGRPQGVESMIVGFLVNTRRRMRPRIHVSASDVRSDGVS